MPLKRRQDEILEKWIDKQNPSVIGQRHADVLELTKKKLKRVVQVTYPVNRAVEAILNKHGVCGSVRIDYYAYGRKLWKLLYKYEKEFYDQLIKGTRTFYISCYTLKADVIDEITEAIIKIVEETKAKEAEELEKTVEETENLIVEKQEEHIVEGDTGGGSQT